MRHKHSNSLKKREMIAKLHIAWGFVSYVIFCVFLVVYVNVYDPYPLGPIVGAVLGFASLAIITFLFDLVLAVRYYVKGDKPIALMCLVLGIISPIIMYFLFVLLTVLVLSAIGLLVKMSILPADFQVFHTLNTGM